MGRWFARRTGSRWCGLWAELGGPCGALGLTRLAALGVVAELLLLEEELLAGGEDEIAAAVDALEDFVGQLHLRVLPDPTPLNRGTIQATDGGKKE